MQEHVQRFYERRTQIKGSGDHVTRQPNVCSAERHLLSSTFVPAAPFTHFHTLHIDQHHVPNSRAPCRVWPCPPLALAGERRASSPDPVSHSPSSASTWCLPPLLHSLDFKLSSADHAKLTPQAVPTTSACSPLASRRDALHGRRLRQV